VRSISEAVSDSGLTLVAVGPAVANTENGTLSVLGQELITDDVTTVIGLDGSLTELDAINSGNFVAVAGEVMESGRLLVTEITVIQDTYIHGTHSVFLKAALRNVDHTVGQATAGAASIQLGQSYYSSEAFALQDGSIGEFIGYTTESTPNQIFAQSALLASDQ